MQDAIVWGIFPHTHVRGKKWEYILELPDGTKKNILSVPTYDFNWQTYYMFKEPLQVPKGRALVSSAWYDNSAGNKSNPDPKVDVKWGDQTWEEMQYTGLLFSPAVAAPATTVRRRSLIRLFGTGARLQSRSGRSTLAACGLCAAFVAVSAAPR